MIKHIILFALITASLQIPHCKETSKTCKSCKDGYTLVKYNYGGSECIEEEKNLYKRNYKTVHMQTTFIPNAIDVKEVMFWIHHKNASKKITVKNLMIMANVQIVDIML